VRIGTMLAQALIGWEDRHDCLSIRWEGARSDDEKDKVLGLVCSRPNGDAVFCFGADT
jgi:hypothetical protein